MKKRINLPNFKTEELDDVLTFLTQTADDTVFIDKRSLQYTLFLLSVQAEKARRCQLAQGKTVTPRRNLPCTS